MAEMFTEGVGNMGGTLHDVNCVGNMDIVSWNAENGSIGCSMVIRILLLCRVLNWVPDEAFYVVVKTHKSQSNKIYNTKLTMIKM